MYFIFEIMGTIAFAISGAMVAIENKMDILGVVILGVTTAIGGGIMRDILIGHTPPTSLEHPLYALISIIVSLIIFFPVFRKKLNLNNWLWVLIDAIGLGIFTVIGLKTALPFNKIWLQIFLGVLTGVGGGVLRDIFAAQKPMIFVRHFYALASLIGAVLCTILMPVNENLATITSIILVVILRMLAAKYKWELPKAKII